MTLVNDIFIQDEVFASWTEHLQEIGSPSAPVTLPTGDELVDRLRYLEIPDEDVPEIIRMAPSPESDADLWWYLQQTLRSLGLYMGRIGGPPRFGTLKDINDPVHRYFYVHVFAAALPRVLEYFADRGISEEVAQATLADLGRNVRVHRKREGIGGLGVAWWLMLHFRGMIYQFGRLQFERAILSDYDAERAQSFGIDVRSGDRVLSIHIPDFCGPMTDESCTKSIAEAHPFFEAHFPEEKISGAVCSSWLLDPQLKEYLRPDSNILLFQDRFQVLPGGYNVNNSIVEFVYGRKLGNPDDLPQHSSLECAVVAHLKAGRTWEGRLGWFNW